MLTWYLLIGVISGVLSGLLGIGGGIIIVPALSILFNYYHVFPEHYIMHAAIATSLAIVILTTASALLSHHKKNLVRWDIVKKILPGLMLGALLGGVIADQLSSHILRLFFGMFLIFVGWHLLQQKPVYITSAPSEKFLLFIAIIIGALSSILGVGGGILLIPVLLYYRVDMRNVAGTSVACAFTIAIVATLTYAFSGLFFTTDVKGATGYIYWPAFMGVAVTSIFFAPLGVALGQKLSTRALKITFALFLWMTALFMLFWGK